MSIRRNDPCPCGSGERYKQCCGKGGGALCPGAATPDLAQTLNAALNAQVAGRLEEAAGLYQTALASSPDCFDALHMFGVVRLQQGDAESACRLMLVALAHQPAESSAVLKNLGLALAAVTQQRSHGAGSQANAARPTIECRHLPPLGADPPLVSIVAPSYNHARYVEAALASVFAQTYTKLELIVVDDGSSDDSLALIRPMLTRAPCPAQLIVRENRGAPATINEGVARAAGRYVGIINTDDGYAPERVELLVRALLHTGAPWGYTGIEPIDEAGMPLPRARSSLAEQLLQSVDKGLRAEPRIAAFATANPVISTGNLFFEKSLWQTLGGFEAYRYNHDWAFCLAAASRVDPCVLAEPLYRYRVHAGNTIKESAERALGEADTLLARWHRETAAEAEGEATRFVRARAQRQSIELATLAGGAGHLLGTERILDFARKLGFTLPAA